ncbi:uroporphyrinogen-III C-methyltransferase [Litchfieldia alkalitelluris]|uniref:uroporphyrinogen-III C-methyltransferase n=1 Tax=Litchfieldia alkalitelluris TaxID=304268 RepID=UPI000996D74B|nr:uroporphyrinogen-III C-methyltransferase [Litchfieldia alkalitelluris]
MRISKVYLVGAGPGDAKLMTIKGLEAIQKADVILYDRLVNPSLLDFSSSSCEKIYCGKLPDRHHLKQDEINKLLVEKALEGKTVVRLKGGDPGVFGRVGEEAEELANHEIPFEIIPGITSGIAAPLYAGIPVTHREYGESFAIVTAHDKSNDGEGKINWEGLAKGIDTIAFYMGIANLQTICEKLIHYGKSENTPVILIQWGTYGRQKTVEGTLSSITTNAKKAQLTNPAITLVGNIISLRSKLKWFENKPLFGRQILLARTGILSSELATDLINQGSDVIEFPKWKKSTLTVDEVILQKIGDYEHILFTSPECVEDFFEALFQSGRDIREITGAIFGASVKSVNALRKKGLNAELTGESSLSSGKLLTVKCEHRMGVQERLERELEGDVYITSTIQLDKDYLPIYERMFQEASIDSVIFPSSKSVSCFIAGLKENLYNHQEFLQNKKVFCMGDKTRDALQANGISDTVISKQATRSSLLDSL